MRKLLLRVMEEAEAAEEVPAICRRIRETREGLLDEDGRKLSQEKVARNMGVTLKTYRAFEKFREPSRKRLRQIAVAMGLPENHFEQAAIGGQLDEILERLARLEARLEADDERPQEPDVPA